MALQLHNKKRVTDAIINLITEDKLAEVKSLLPYLGNYKSIESRFIINAIIHCASDCSNFFINSFDAPNLRVAFHGCKFNKILDVYNFCIKLSNEHNISFLVSKEDVIERILEASKVDKNPQRVDYFLSIIESGFITFEESKYYINELQNKAKNDNSKNSLKKVFRELRFYELGI